MENRKRKMITALVLKYECIKVLMLSLGIFVIFLIKVDFQSHVKLVRIRIVCRRSYATIQR